MLQSFKSLLHVVFFFLMLHIMYMNGVSPVALSFQFFPSCEHIFSCTWKLSQAWKFKSFTTICSIWSKHSIYARTKCPIYFYWHPVSETRRETMLTWLSPTHWEEYTEELPEITSNSMKFCVWPIIYDPLSLSQIIIILSPFLK